MKKARAVLLFAISLFVFDNGFSQITIDPTVEARYKEAIKKVPEEFQVVFKKKDEPGLSKEMRNFFRKTGYGIYTLYQLDTLNKEDIFPYAKGTGEINDLGFYDSATGKFLPAEEPKKYAFSDGNNTYIPVYNIAVLKNDSVHINMSLWEPDIRTTVTSRSISSIYWDYRKYDSIFKLSSDGVKLKEINLPMKTIHFTLSTNHYKIGETLYGEAEQETPVFFEENPLYKTGYTKQRLHVKYIFQLIIMSPEDHF